MGKPDVNIPPPPDPTRTVQAQQQASIQSAIASSLLNQLGEVGPLGTTTFAQQPGPGINIGGFNIPQFTRTTTLTPEAQAQLEASQQIGRQATALGLSNIGQVQAAQAQPLSFANLPALPTGIDIQGPLAGFQAPQVTGGQQFQPQQLGPTGIPIGGRIQGQVRGIQPTQALQLPSVPGGGIDLLNLPSAPTPFAPGGIDLGALPSAPPIEALAPLVQRQEQAAFERQRLLLEPEFARERQRLGIEAAERGLPLGAEARRGLFEPFETGRQRALQQAALQAVGVGQATGERLFGQAGQARQAALQEQLAAGEFGRAGGAQAFQQAQQARQTGFGEQLAAGQFARAGQQQTVEQFLASTALGGQLGGQQFAQQLAGAQFGRAGQQQQFGQAQAQAQFANVAQQQAFQQALQQAGLQAGARATGIQERAFQRGLPINELAALLGAAPGVQLPQFQALPSFGIAAPDVIGATLGSAQLGQQRAGLQQQAQSGFLGDIFGLGGALGGAGIEFGFGNLFSDMFVKRDIEEIGMMPNGLKIYKFRYNWSDTVEYGVMAQEVEKVMPEAVSDIMGIKTVDYDMVMEVAGHG